MKHFIKQKLRSTCFAFSLIMVITPGSVVVAASEEANEIAALLVTEEAIDAAFQAMRPMMVPAIKQISEDHGMDLNPKREDLFMDIFLKSMKDDFLAKHPANIAKIHDDLFTPEQLKAIVDFYKSDAGQAYAKLQPEIMTLSAKAGSIVGEQAGAHAYGEMNRLIKEEGIEFYKDKSLIKRLLGR